MAERSKPSNGSAEARPQRPRKANVAPRAVSAVVPEPTAPVAGEDGASPDAGRVELRRSAVARVDSDRLEVSQGAVGAARAEQIVVEQGAIGAALADRVELSRGYARSIISRQAQLDRAAARVVIAADVRADRSAVMFLVARKVEGNVRVLFDWRGAIAFGAVAGLIFAIVGRRRGGRQQS
jgi:hypothetical protein